MITFVAFTPAQYLVMPQCFAISGNAFPQAGQNFYDKGLLCAVYYPMAFLLMRFRMILLNLK